MVKMLTHTEAQTFEFQNLKTSLFLLEFVKISSMTPSQFQTWFEIEVSQIRSATPDVT